MVVGDLVDDGDQGAARDAPFGPELDEDGLVGLQNVGLERVVGDISHGGHSVPFIVTEMVYAYGLYSRRGARGSIESMAHQAFPARSAEASRTIRNRGSPFCNRWSSRLASSRGARSMIGLIPLSRAKLIASSMSSGLQVTCPVMLWASATSWPDGTGIDPPSAPRTPSRPRARRPWVSSATGSVVDAVLIMTSAPPASRNNAPAPPEA